MLEWKNVFTYSEDEEAPRAFRLELGFVNITIFHPISNHICFPPDVWTLCAPEVGINDPRALISRDIEEAKREALEIVHDRLITMAMAVKRAIQENNS